MAEDSVADADELKNSVSGQKWCEQVCPGQRLPGAAGALAGVTHSMQSYT